MLNFDDDVEANADVKYEQTLRVYSDSVIVKLNFSLMLVQYNPITQWLVHTIAIVEKIACFIRPLAATDLIRTSFLTMLLSRSQSSSVNGA